MPTVIDSLFLELGIDTSKFSSDQKKALEKISKFETQSKRSADKAAGAVKTVGKAFRDIADDTAIGSSARRLDTFSMKLRALGQSAQVSGGMGSPLGKMAEGLGMLMSPATLGVAALGMLGAAAWDFNKKMTAANATIFRQSQLAGMNSKNLWSWGEAAHMVGAQPQDITGGIAALQTAITGMGIGAGNASAQLVALARLGGIRWNFQSGVDTTQLFERVHQLAAQRGYKNLGSLRALTAPLMTEAMWNLATDPKFDPAKLHGQIAKMAPANLSGIIKSSLESQKLLGKKDIAAAVVAEQGYSILQNPMDRLIGLMTNLLADTSAILRWTIKTAGWISDIWNFIVHPGKDLKNPVAKVVDKHLKADFISHGMKPKAAAEAAAAATPKVGQAVKESFGLVGKEMFWPFALMEKAPAMMAAEIFKWLHSDPRSQSALPKGPMVGLEVFGTSSQISNYMKALSAAQFRPHVMHSTVTHHTKIGAVTVHTKATDARAMAEGTRSALSAHPLIKAPSQHTVSLAARGAQ